MSTQPLDTFDVIVIGAGMAGASVAAELSATTRVLLLEREEQPGAKERLNHLGVEVTVDSELDDAEARLQLSDFIASNRSTSICCHAEQDKFWQLRELFFQNQKKLKPEHIAEYAQQVGIDTEPFNQCIDSKRYLDDIKSDMAEAEKQRISGTPTFVIGKTTADIIKGRRIVGAQAYKVFSDEIEAQLRAATK